MRSNPAYQLFFIFEPENILRSYLNFSTSSGRLTDLKSLLGLLLVSVIWIGEKIVCMTWLFKYWMFHLFFSRNLESAGGTLFVADNSVICAYVCLNNKFKAWRGSEQLLWDGIIFWILKIEPVCFCRLDFPDVTNLKRTKQNLTK